MLFARSRRQFLRQGVTTGALVGLGDVGFLAHLAPVSAADADLDPQHVRLRPEIEPVVRLLEETPRDQLLERVAAKIRQGLSYRELLAGLLLAGVKNVEPRPSVGHKFHTVLVVNSAHLASLSSPAEHRWLPIFWALDYYKSAAARDVRERGDWTMGPVEEGLVPPARRAKQAFLAAMDSWDESAADAAIVGLARSAGAQAVYELLFRYGARDFRSIGHKAIFVANSWRTLQCIGWQHAEPVLRSLVYALLMHEGGNPQSRDADADRPFRRNQQLVEQFRDDWQDGTLDTGATQALLAALRVDGPESICDHVVAQISAGVAPQSVWDALHVGAAELLMRQPGIVALHAVTTTNALYYAYLAAADDRTRRLLVLQNAAFLTLFRAAMVADGGVRPATIRILDGEPTDAVRPPTVEEVFADLSRQPMLAAQKTLSLLRGSGSVEQLIDAARVLIFLKGDNAHDYKFSSAVLEDYFHVSPAWRDYYLAANMFKLRGTLDDDNQLVARTRDALRG